MIEGEEERRGEERREEKRKEEKLASRMTSGSEGGACFLHRITKPAAWGGRGIYGGGTAEDAVA